VLGVSRHGPIYGIGHGVSPGHNIVHSPVHGVAYVPEHGVAYVPVHSFRTARLTAPVPPTASCTFLFFPLKIMLHDLLRNVGAERKKS